MSSHRAATYSGPASTALDHATIRHLLPRVSRLARWLCVAALVVSSSCERKTPPPRSLGKHAQINWVVDFPMTCCITRGVEVIIPPWLEDRVFRQINELAWTKGIVAGNCIHSDTRGPTGVFVYWCDTGKFDWAETSAELTGEAAKIYAELAPKMKQAEQCQSIDITK